MQFTALVCGYSDESTDDKPNYGIVLNPTYTERLEPSILITGLTKDELAQFPMDQAITVEVTTGTEIPEIERLQHENGALRAVLSSMKTGNVNGVPCFCPFGRPNPPMNSTFHSIRCQRARALWQSAVEAGHIAHPLPGF